MFGLRVGITYGGADRVPKGRNVLHSAPYISWLYNNARVKRRALSLDATDSCVGSPAGRPVHAVCPSRFELAYRGDVIHCVTV